MSSLGPARLPFLLFVALAACSSEDDDDNGNETPPPSPPALVASFNAANNELPEGLAYRDGAAYVGFAPTGVVAKVDPATGSFQAFGQLPSPAPPTQGFMTGLAFDAEGSLYAALAIFSGDVKAGIYRIGKDGGDAVLFAEHPDMKFPNGLEFDSTGRLWVTDSAKGAVFRIASNGAVSLFSDNALLKGQRGHCGAGTDAGFEIGANGIALGQGVVYVANSDKATLVEIAIGNDDTAGAAKNLVGPNCEQLGGSDGLVRTLSGALYVAVGRFNQIVRVRPGGALDVLGRGAPLDFPASLAVATQNQADTLWITSFALANANAGTNPKPALVRLAL